MARAYRSSSPTCFGANAMEARMGSAMQVGRKGRSPGDGGSIATSVRRSADRSLYKIDRLQGDGLMPGRRRGLGA